jgi:hypothetical protein
MNANATENRGDTNIRITASPPQSSAVGPGSMPLTIAKMTDATIAVPAITIAEMDNTRHKAARSRNV